MDREILDLYRIGSRYDSNYVSSEFDLALKIGHLFCAGRLLLPLSSYFESPLRSLLLPQWEALFESHEIAAAASELDYEEFIATKQDQYKREINRHPAYFDPTSIRRLRDLHIPILRRNRSSTRDIAQVWRTEVPANMALMSGLSRRRTVRTVSRFERDIVELPERLAGDAFVWDFVKPLIPVNGVTSDESFAFQELISREYVRSYIKEFDAYALCDFSLGDFGLGLELAELQSIRLLRRLLRFAGIEEDIVSLVWREVLSLKYDPLFVQFAALATMWTATRDLPADCLAVLQAVRSRDNLGSAKQKILRTAASVTRSSSNLLQTTSIYGGVTEREQSRDYNALLRELEKLPTGQEHADAYERLIEPLITGLFSPVLINPIRQSKLHQGRKRVDLTYQNNMDTGFFNWLGKHYTCPYVFVECKNYGSDIGNPEVDQLAGRFSPARGQVGFLVCRSMADLEKLIARCRDTAADQRGYIIPLQDSDFKNLVAAKQEPLFFELPLLRRTFDRLIF